MLKKRLQIAVGILVIVILCLLVYQQNKSQENKHYYPNFTTKHYKGLGDKEWKHFDDAVSECRAILKNNTFLQARSSFWERHGVEPAVGYAAWLFQESRFNGFAIGDQGRAHGYGQIHIAALSEMNNIRRQRGDKEFSHDELVGESPELLEFFLESFHDYIELCKRRYSSRPTTMKASLNAWNGGGKNGKIQESKYSGGIKSMILQYYERKRAEEQRKKKAGAQAYRPLSFTKL